MGTPIDTPVSDIALADWKRASQHTTTPHDRFMRRKEVELVTGMCKKILYRRWIKGKFPKPIRLSQRLIVWPRQEILDWMEEQKQRRAEAESCTSSKDR
jgi:prophage regulatory protein